MNFFILAVVGFLLALLFSPQHRQILRIVLEHIGVVEAPLDHEEAIEVSRLRQYHPVSVTVANAALLHYNMNCEELAECIVCNPVNLESLEHVLEKFHEALIEDQVKLYDQPFVIWKLHDWVDCDLLDGVFVDPQNDTISDDKSLNVAGCVSCQGQLAVESPCCRWGSFGGDAFAHETVGNITFSAISTGHGMHANLAAMIAVKLAVLSGSKAPFSSVTKYGGLLATRMRDIFCLARVDASCSVVLTRIDEDEVEVMSVGGACALITLSDGQVIKSEVGDAMIDPNLRLSPYFIRRYSIPKQTVSSIVLCSEGVQKSLYDRDIVSARSAKMVIERALHTSNERRSQSSSAAAGLPTNNFDFSAIKMIFIN